ncbi:hypothetical protein ABT143_32595 [Streptomyces sp. NPDC002033]
MNLATLLILAVVVVVIALIVAAPAVPVRRNPSVRRTGTRLTTVPAPRGGGRHRSEH